MLEKATEEEIKRTKTEADKQEAADSKNSEGKRDKLTAEMNELKAKLDNLTSEHREEEADLRRVSSINVFNEFNIHYLSMVQIAVIFSYSCIVLP